MIEPWKVTVCCRNVVHRDGSEASCAKWIDIHIFIFSQFDNMVKQKLKKPSSFWQIKKLCHQYALKDHDEVEKTHYFNC